MLRLLMSHKSSFRQQRWQCTGGLIMKCHAQLATDATPSCLNPLTATSQLIAIIEAAKKGGGCV